MADGSVIIEAILDTANVPKQITGLKNAIKGVTWDDISKGTDKAQALSSAFKSAGTSCTAMLTVPIMAAGKEMTQMSWQFDDAMAKVSTIADTTQVPMDELRASILDLSDQTGISAAEIADNVYNAISAGQETGDAVNFVAQATKLATAGFTDSASALDVMSTVMNAYKLSAEDTTRVTDVLIMTQNKGKTTVGELSASMGKAIPTAAAFNVNLEQLAAAYATTTANGIATAESTTYINSMIKELGDSGSDVGKIIQEKLGMSFSEAMASGMSLGDVLNVLNEHGAETGQTMYDMFGSAEAASAAATLASDGASKFTENLEAMNGAAGITDESFEKMQTTTFDLNRAMNEIKNVMIELGSTIGTALQPAIEGFVNGVHGFTEWFKSIGPEGQRVILVIAGIVAAIGPLLTVVGHVIAIIPQLQAGIAAVKAALAAAAGGTGALGAAFSALTGPVGVVLAVIAALVAAVVYLWNTDEGFRDAVMAAWEQVQAAISSAIEAAMPYIEQIVDFITGTVMPVVSEVAQLVLQAMASMLEVVLSTMPSMLETISGALSTIKGVFETVVGLIVGLVTGDFSMMERGVEDIMSGLSRFLDGIWNTITGLISGAVDKIGEFLGFPGLGDKVRGVFETVRGFIEDPLGTARDFVRGIPDEIVGFFSGIGQRITDAIGNIYFPTPHVEWGGFEVGGVQVPLPTVEWYAEGGVFAANDPRMIGIGDASEPEAAAPISVLKKYVRDAVSEAGGAGLTVSVNIENYNQQTDMDVNRLVDLVVRDIEHRIARKKSLGGTVA